MNSNQGIQ